MEIPSPSLSSTEETFVSQIKAIDASVQQQLDLLDQETIAELDNVSLLDLLCHSAAGFEVFSAIGNVASLGYLYPSREEDKVVESAFTTINSVFPRHITNQIFEIRKAVHNKRKDYLLPNKRPSYFPKNGFRMTRVSPSRRFEPPVKVQLEAEVITPEQVLAYAHSFIEQRAAVGETTFVRSDFTSFVESNYHKDQTAINNQRLIWSVDDSNNSSAGEPNWKTKCSTALSSVQTEGLITYRKQKDHWYIFTD